MVLGYGVVRSSEKIVRDLIWKFFYPFREIGLKRMGGRRMERGFLEMIPASASAKNHLIDISLVYWKTFTHLQPEFIVRAAESSLCQHGAMKNE
jgi:hypothetical protein